jgi:hypothetical protein
MTGVLAEIRTEYLPNTSVERYHYTNMFGKIVWSYNSTPPILLHDVVLN